jgi:hypothetical protein
MKYLVPLTVLVLFTCAAVNAQNNNVVKPSLFKRFPNQISCNYPELDKAFGTNLSQQANLSFSNNFSFRGIVISNITRYGNMQTVLIQSKDFSDAVLSITKITLPNGQTTFKGRIVNTKYADGYELKKDAAGNYQLIKFETDKLLQDCKQ